MYGFFVPLLKRNEGKARCVTRGGQGQKSIIRQSLPFFEGGDFSLTGSIGFYTVKLRVRK
jgi:hypothetical protein